MNLEDVILLLSTIICGFTVIAILIISISHIQLFRYHYKIHCSIKVFTHLVNIAALSASISLFCIVFIALIESNGSMHNDINTPFAFIAGFCSNSMVQIGSYIIYLLRVRYIFQHSIWRISNLVSGIMFTIFIGFVLSSMYLLYFLYFADIDDETQLDRHINRGNTLQQVFGFTIYFALILLFTIKLFKVITIVKSTDTINDIDESVRDNIEMSSHSQSGSHTTKPTRIAANTDILTLTTTSAADIFTALSPPRNYFNDKQENLMHVLTRTSVLLSISITCSVGLNIAFIFLKYAFPDNEYDTIIVRVYQCVYCLIEVLCLFLNYKRNDKMYRKLCYRCNKSCYCCCKWINYNFVDKDNIIIDDEFDIDKLPNMGSTTITDIDGFRGR